VNDGLVAVGQDWEVDLIGAIRRRPLSRSHQIPIKKCITDLIGADRTDEIGESRLVGIY
jgi:hypothetical protein